MASVHLLQADTADPFHAHLLSYTSYMTEKLQKRTINSNPPPPPTPLHILQMTYHFSVIKSPLSSSLTTLVVLDVFQLFFEKQQKKQKIALHTNSGSSQSNSICSLSNSRCFLSNSRYSQSNLRSFQSNTRSSQSSSKYSQVFHIWFGLVQSGSVLQKNQLESRSVHISICYSTHADKVYLRRKTSHFVLLLQDWIIFLIFCTIW